MVEPAGGDRFPGSDHKGRVWKGGQREGSPRPGSSQHSPCEVQQFITLLQLMGMSSRTISLGITDGGER